MKFNKKIVALEIAALAILGTSITVFAAETGNDAVKKERYDAKKAQVEARVKDGTITQQRADEILKNMQERQAECDGTRSGKGREDSLGKGRGRGQGRGDGNGLGRGRGNMNGMGRNGGNGSCIK